jgi:hypothetical protein
MIAQFALRLTCGISLMWLLMPRRQITSGFFRIQMLLALALAALAALTLGRFEANSSSSPILPVTPGRILCGVLAAIAYLGSIAWTLERRKLGTWCVCGVAGLSTAILLFSSVSADQIGTPVGVLTLFSEVATSLLIGGATAGMLLGHWYLTAPTMSITPLGRVNLCFGLSALLRLVVSLIGLVLVWPSLTGGTPALWLVLRWTAGIAGPLVLTVMVWRILRYRNTQAATGVLFVGVIVTFIGELSATLVSREMHLPL